jgi:hypothetical protein
MRWYHYLAYFFGGAFLANTLPHVANGISGSPFQGPFASPPGEGLSSSVVNVLWGLFNLAVGYLLVCRVGGAAGGALLGALVGPRLARGAAARSVHPG